VRARFYRAAVGRWVGLGLGEAMRSVCDPCLVHRRSSESVSILLSPDRPRDGHGVEGAVALHYYTAQC
jgi:hypothetical protein